MGSLERLDEIHFHLGNADESILYLRKLCQLFPYSFDYLFRLLSTILELKGVPATMEELETNHQHHDQQAIDVFKSRILYLDKDFAEAKAISEFELVIPELQYFHANTQIANAKELTDFELMKERVDQSLERWPEDQYLQEQKSLLLIDEDQEKAAVYLKDLLKKGIASPYLVLMYLEVRNEDINSAFSIMKSADPTTQRVLVDAFGQCFNQPPYDAKRLRFLFWMRDNLPEYQGYREALAIHLNKFGRTKDAIKVAKSLLEEDPENAHWLSLNGKCYWEEDPESALEYFKKAYELTNVVEYLTDIGNCYQNLNDQDTASEYYWKAIGQSPHNANALTNLYTLLGPTEKLRDLFFQAVEQGYGANQQMFHVNAVDLARHFNTTVPGNWIKSAEQRYQVILKENDGYPKELEKLGLLIQYWFKVLGMAEYADEYSQGIFINLRLSYFPGKRWIPPKESM